MSFRWPESSPAIDSPAGGAPEKTETSGQPNRGDSKGRRPTYTNRSEKNDAPERKPTEEYKRLPEEGLRRLPEAQDQAGLRRVSDYLSGDLDPSDKESLSHSLALFALSLSLSLGPRLHNSGRV